MLKVFRLILGKNRIKGLKNIKFSKNIRVTKTKIKIDDGNEIVINKNVYLNNLDIRVRGRGNKIIIAEGSKISGKLEISSTQSLIDIGSNSNINSEIIIFSGDRNTVKIGDNVNIHGAQISSSCDDNFIRIERGCLISNSIIRNNDAHKIYKEKQLINKGKGICIKENVWLAANTVILKWVEINSGNIIGIGSIITKHILCKNSIIVGNGKIIENDITWKE